MERQLPFEMYAQGTDGEEYFNNSTPIQVPSTPRQPTTGSQLLADAPTPGLQGAALGRGPEPSHMQVLTDNGMVPATVDELRASRKVLNFLRLSS